MYWFLVDRVEAWAGKMPKEKYKIFATSYKPLYQLAYMMGLQFMALKRELVDTKKMTLKQYHDAILKENSMPIEILRELFWPIRNWAGILVQTGDFFKG